MFPSASSDALATVEGFSENDCSSNLPGGLEGESGLFCYECHEELIHNPVFLPGDLRVLAKSKDPALKE